MKLLSICLGSRKGEFEIHGIADLPHSEVKFQTLANGLVFCETDNYEDAREVVLEAVAINQNNRESVN